MAVNFIAARPCYSSIIKDKYLKFVFISKIMSIFLVIHKVIKETFVTQPN